VVTAPAPAEQQICKLQFLMSDHGEKQVFTNFAVCELFLDFSDQILRHDNSCVHVQGSNASYENSTIQIAL